MNLVNLLYNKQDRIVLGGRRNTLGKNLLAPAAMFLILAGAVWSGPDNSFALLPAVAKTTDALEPNYVDKLSHRVAWRKFPVNVYFILDSNYSESREQFARHGFNRWVIATDGLLDYVVTDDVDEANITVRFEPRTDNGYTQTRFVDKRLRRADIIVGIRQGSQTDVEAIAAHEFGHAMGIDGHSDNKRDLMYPVHRAGAPGRITDRDLNTMASRYPVLAKLLAERYDERDNQPGERRGAAR